MRYRIATLRLTVEVIIHLQTNVNRKSEKIAKFFSGLQFQGFQGYPSLRHMNSELLLTTLRQAINDRGMPLAKLSEKTGVSYFKIYRFFTSNRSLSLEDADKLHVFLTGKSFIQLPDADDHAL